MRFTRLLLLIAAAAAIAAVAVPSAGALTFPDDICPVDTGTVIKVCPQGEIGKPYSYQIKGRDGTGCVPYVTFKSVGTMPPGLSISSDGLISGTPTQTGDYIFYIQMQDIPASQGGVFWCADDNSTEKQFEISIVQGVQIQQRQSVLTPGQLTVPYSLQFTATGGTPTWAVSSGALPAGLTLSSTGLLSGTPTAAGDYNFKVTATAGTRSDTQTYAMSVVPKLQLAAVHGVAELGVPFRAAPQATGGKQPYAWSVDASTPLPAGLTLDPATGVISGTPTTAGNSAVKLTVTDTGTGLAVTQNIAFTVVPHVLLLKKPLRPAKAHARYSAILLKSGGARPFTWSATGLPRGLRLNAATGRLTGIAGAAGTYRLRVRVKDGLGAVSSRTYLLKVAG
jgi:large repetitive protein